MYISNNKNTHRNKGEDIKTAPGIVLAAIYLSVIWKLSPPIGTIVGINNVLTKMLKTIPTFTLRCLVLLGQMFP